MKVIQGHSAGIVGTSGMVVGKTEVSEWFSALVPETPAEWLIFLSTLLVLLQLGHYGWRFYRFLRKKNETD
jgi:hypothetical protein